MYGPGCLAGTQTSDTEENTRNVKWLTTAALVALTTAGCLESNGYPNSSYRHDRNSGGYWNSPRADYDHDGIPNRYNRDANGDRIPDRYQGR